MKTQAVNRHITAILTVTIVAAVTNSAFAAEGNSSSLVPNDVQKIMRTFCVDCHSGPEPEGGLLLNADKPSFSGADQLKAWEQVHTMVSMRVMPPPDSDQPTDRQRSILLKWLHKNLVEQSPIGGTPLRRLSRREYANTIRHGFALKNFELPDSFPPDNSVQGFDNLGEELVIAVSHMEAFAETASVVADEFFSPPRPVAEAAEWKIPAKDLVISYSSACLIDGGMRLASSGKNFRRNATWPARFEAPANGRYSIEVTASAFNPPEDTPLLDVSEFISDRGTGDSLKTLTIDSETPKTFRFEADLDRGHSLVFRYTNGPFDYEDKNAYSTFLTELFARDPRIAAAWAEVGDPARGGSGWQRVAETMQSAELNVDDFAPGSKAVEKLIKKMVSNSVKSGESLVYRFFESGPAVCIHDVRISGPITQYPDADDVRVERQRSQLMGASIGKSDTESLTTFLSSFLGKVFRRPAAPEEVDAYLQLIQRELKTTGDLNAAMHLAVRTALISPEFLYRNIASEAGESFQMASRLSYFLTSGPPDEQLHKAAASGQLKKSTVLRKEAERLISDAFVHDFTTQWLGLSVVDNLMPDQRLIQKFTGSHRKTMRTEVEKTFKHVLENNLPISDLIAPDFLFTEPLVGWEIYELEDFKPSKGKKPKYNRNLRKIDIPRDGRRGGLLSMPAVMMATANGVDTQPVLRGVWMLENILGTPPPEPPDAVPALTPDTTETNTPKERLAAHMASSNCAVCHREIDPLGFVLENFDPIGRWRDHYPKYIDDKGKTKLTKGAAVDASGVLPGGQPLKDITDLKRILAEDPEPFARCVSEKLLTYATGRELNYRERDIVRQIVRMQKQNEYRFRDLLLALIASPVFMAP